MKPINGFKPEAPKAGYPMLPKGLYIGTIQAVKIEGAAPDQQLVLRIDITEGEYAGYYTKRYHSDKDAGGKYEVRYKGDFKIQIPDEANTKRQHYDWDLRTLNNSIWAIEDSNDGYHWDWNESGLKGKAIGINVREGSYNGSPYTIIGRLESVKAIKAGTAKVMKDLAPRGSAAQGSSSADNFTIVEDDEVPF